MTARSTMSSLITTLRGMANAGTVDFSIAGVSYWTDDQLQTILDRYRIEVRDEQLTSFAITVSGGSVNWRDYQSAYRWFETTDAGTARFYLQDSTGANAGTAWSADYEKGLVSFDANTGGTVYYLTGFAFDVYGAAADVWQQKAAQYATMPDFTTDNHSVKRSNLVAQCERMAQRYEAMSTTGGASSGSMDRGDYR